MSMNDTVADEDTRLGGGELAMMCRTGLRALIVGARGLRARPGPIAGISARHFGAHGPVILRTGPSYQSFDVLGLWWLASHSKPWLCRTIQRSQ